MGFNANEAAGGGSKTDQPLIEVGNYPARLVQLIDLGLQPQSYAGKVKDPVREIRTTYELPTELCVDEDGNEDPERPRWLGEEFPLYNLNSEKARSTLRLKGIDPAGHLNGDWAAAVESACTLTVVHNDGKGKNAGKVFANIGGISPPMKGMEIGPLVQPKLIWDLDDPDMEAFEKFPEFIQKKIKGNLNFRGSILEARLNGTDEPAPAEGGGDANPDAVDGDNPYG